MRAAARRLLLCLTVLVGSCPGLPVRAAVDVSAQRVATHGVTLQGVRLRLDGAAAGALAVHLHADQVDLPALGWRHVGLDLDGNLSRSADLAWQLDGTMHLQGAPGGALGQTRVHLLIDDMQNTLQLDLKQNLASASAWMPLDQPTHLQIHLRHMPAGWLQGLVSTVWSGRLSHGRIDAEMALDVHDDGLQSSGTFTLDRVGFENPAGTLAGDGLNATGRLGLDTRGGPAQINLDSTLRGGELLLGSLYLDLPAHPVQLGVGARVGQGVTRIDRLRVGDPDALQLDGSLVLDSDGALRHLQLDRFRAQFPAAYQRYGKAWLATMGLRDVSIAGGLTGSVEMDGGTPARLAFATDGLDLATGDGTLGVSGLRGSLDWAAQGDRPPSTLAWRGIRLYRLPFGSAQAHWTSHAGTLSLQAPLALALFGGEVHLNGLDWRPAATAGERLGMSLAVTGVDMAAFSQAMGWPQFPGTLGGAIPSLRWTDDHVDLDGGLTVNVFDGFVDITRLALRQPFGPSPVMAADVSLRGLDLAAITSVFDFGGITGRLDGRIGQLRLVDWNPVQFQASLHADQGGRISQRAVNNLTSVGGGGIAAGLQGAVLKLFKTFGYSRIGLSCILADSVCRMGGLEPAGDGYLIVDGSGLPHLNVIGHQRQVDWPTLVSRLKAATEGGGPQIR